MRRVAWLNLRYTVPKRVELYRSGLQRLGYRVEMGCPASPSGLLVTWNRIQQGESAARQFESAGLPVLVAENASWGNEFAGGHWHHIARGHHNTAGRFPIGGPERWDSLGIDLEPMRHGGEQVILAQRSIGSAPVAMPRDWPAVAQARHGGRIRLHPGNRPCTPLRSDLARAGSVVTWGSGAAILAALWGCRVHSEMPGWIGEHGPEGRLAMFRRLAWAQWRMDEIESGEAFARLLEAS